MWISICKALKGDPWQDTNICCCYDCPFRFYFHFETILSLQKSCKNISEFRLPFAQLPLMLKPPTTIGWWPTMLFSHSVVSDSFATPWTVAPQAPLSMGFLHGWSGLPFPSPGDLPDAEIKPMSCALALEFFTTEPLGKPGSTISCSIKYRK